MENFDTTAFINMVDNFYNNAFNNLLLFGGLFVIIVSIVMPIVLQLLSRRYQSGEYDKMEINLKKEFTQIIETKAKSMEENNKKIIQEELVSLNKEVNYAIGVSFHISGFVLQQQERYLEAIESYITAIYNQIKSDKAEHDIKKLLGNIETLYSGTPSTFENRYEFKKQKNSILKLISHIENVYNNMKFYDEIDKLRKAIDKKSLD